MSAPPHDFVLVNPSILRISGDFEQVQAHNGAFPFCYRVADMRCPNCETETTMLIACPRCLLLYGEGCCCLLCYQACKKLEVPVDRKTAQDVRPPDPPTIH